MLGYPRFSKVITRIQKESELMSQTLQTSLQKILERHQAQLGYSHFGWAELTTPISFPVYQEWIQQGLHGEMNYLKDHLAKKQSPKTHWPMARSSFAFAFPYFPVGTPATQGSTAVAFPIASPRVSLYAQGADYHFWLREKLESLASELQTIFPSESFTCATDSIPLMERDLAYRAGLGWIGKNTCLIHPQKGSLFLLGEIITSLELSNPNPMLPDFCGSCNRCIQACPTQAIVADKKLDARKCISYLTIESRKVPDIELRVKMGDWFFGCDICQTVCPWNQKIFKAFAYPASHEALPQRPLLADQRQKLVQDLSFFLKASGKQIQKKVRSTPLARAGAFGLRRNAMVVAGNQNLTELRGEIESYLQNEKLSDLAKWTLARWQDLELEDRN